MLIKHLQIANLFARNNEENKIQKKVNFGDGIMKSGK